MATIRDLVQTCDVGGSDAFTVGDTAAAYTATVRSRPFFLAGLMHHHGVQSATLLALSVVGSLTVKVVRDFGRETLAFDCSLTSDEEVTIVDLDDANAAALIASEFEFTDAATVAQWELHQFAVKADKQESA